MDSERQPLLTQQVSRTSAPAQGELEHENIDTTSWLQETKIILRYSLPLIPTYLLQYAYQMTIILAASQLSTTELAGVSLGIMTSNILGYAVFEGMATALDTLCPQAYGGGHFHLVGLYTIRATLLLNLVAVPIALAWYFSTEILYHVVPQRALAEHAGVFLRWSIVGIPGYCSFEAAKRFMQAQNNFTAGFVVLCCSLPLNIFLNWLLVYHFHLRIIGCALAASLTNLVRPGLLLAYAVGLDRKSLKCWPTPDKLTLASITADWWPMICLAIPATVMTLSEWLAYEILQISTSYISEADLAAQTFAGTAVNLCWHIPFAISIATSTRVGQMIGSGKVDVARVASWCHGSIFIGTGIFNVGLEALLVGLSGKYLTHDPQVSNATIKSIPFVAIFVFFDAVATWTHGIVRGLGWQRIGSTASLIGFYVYGVPVALFLELSTLTKLGIAGLWIGLGSALALVSFAEGAVVMFRPWQRAYEEAMKRQEDET
jgi:multidrug resistance protein, MATE family